MMNTSITKKNQKTTLPPSWGIPTPSKASSGTSGISASSTTTISAKTTTVKPSNKTSKGFDVKTTSLLASLTKTTKSGKKTTKAAKTVTTSKIVATSTTKTTSTATVSLPSASVVKASTTETRPVVSIKKNKSSSSTKVLPENFDKLGPTIVDEQGREQSTMDFLVNRFDKVLKHDPKLSVIANGNSKTQGTFVLTSDRSVAEASTKMSWANVDEDSDDDDDDDVDLTAIAHKSWTKVVSGNGKSGKTDKKPLAKVTLPTVASIQQARSLQNNTDETTQTGDDDWTNVKGQRKHWKNRTLEDLEHVVVEDKSYDVDAYRALTRDQKQKLRLLREARRANRRQRGSHRRRR